ncbi:MAG: CHAP domain-containing protein [Bryobacterales bacterium]|nr:CHAP domain-containing protein [Bryobacterales bacterium]
MPTPVEFMNRYRNIRVNAVIDDAAAGVCRLGTHAVQLRKYFLMDWTDGAEERSDYNAVTRGSARDAWFQANKEKIKTAAMGKGAPDDYALALEWAVRSGKIPNVTQATIQTYFDDHLGIDCSGFVTNYLVAAGKKAYSAHTLRNTSAASYFRPAKAINDCTQVQQGDLLVWMSGNAVKSDPGHIAVVESYVAQSRVGGNLRVVESTGANGANPKLLDSMYTVEQILPKQGARPAMVLVVKRHGVSGSTVAVIRE